MVGGIKNTHLHPRIGAVTDSRLMIVARNSSIWIEIPRQVPIVMWRLTRDKNKINRDFLNVDWMENILKKKNTFCKN
jgi:hypothetical protein